MADETQKPSSPQSFVVDRQGKRVASTRERGTNTVVRDTSTRKVASANGKQFASAGRYSRMKEGSDDEIQDDHRIQAIRQAATGTVASRNSGWGMYEVVKTGALFSDGALGYADIQDSNNIGYYSYEFPVDALELPSSRPEELRFYRLAYDRDPIVGRAIDMHTELPLSKMVLEKPKCSSDEYADYIYDYFTGMVNNTKLFQVLIDAVREYWTIGEAFLFVEEYDDVKPCPAAEKILNKKGKGMGADPTKESENGPLGGTAGRILDFLSPEKHAAWVKKRASEIDTLRKAGIKFSFEEGLDGVRQEILAKRASLNVSMRKVAKLAKELSRSNADDSYPISITAAPGDDAPPPADAPAPDATGADLGGEGEPMGDAGMEGVDGAGGGDLGGEMGDLGDLGGGGGGMPPMGGGGGGGFSPDGPSTPAGGTGDVRDAIAMGSTISAQREIMEMKHYLRLLEKKKQLLEELKEIREKKKEELELFSHVTNPDYEGFDRIQVLAPEQVEMAADGLMGDQPTIYYKPPEKQKQAYLEDPDVAPEVKDTLQQDGKVALNQDPFSGSYVIHFARKKSGYELHGRSILQRCIRTVIYREKLRQVQSTLASRNMTPKTLVIAPDIPPSEVMALRAHIDEAKSDPDYSVVLNYEARWDEIGSEGRLLSLDAEWQHTNSDLSIGLGLSPELLIGEGMYSGNRIQLEIMNVSYTQFRDVLTGIIEDQIFRPVAMKKGFYEMDKYGRPRWIYPKVTFSRMALRDSGDLYDMLFNLYSKGSLPVEIILEFLNIDPEDCKQKLEDSLFTVNDSKFNELLSNIYNSIGQVVMEKSDLVKRVIKGLTLDEVDNEAEEGPEGSGEGMG
jgi:hypothetical protein